MQPSVRGRSGGRGTEEDDQNGEEENEEGVCVFATDARVQRVGRMKPLGEEMKRR